MGERRIRVTMDITVDDSIGNDLGMRQNVYDAVINYLHVRHLMDSMKHMTAEPPENSNINMEIWKEGTRRLQAYHKNWSEIIEKADYDIVEL